MLTDPRIEQWTKRVDGTIKAEVMRMHHHMSAWQRVSESYTQMLWTGLKRKAAYLPGC